MDDQVSFAQVEKAVDGSRCKFARRTTQRRSFEKLVDGQNKRTVWSKFEAATEQPNFHLNAMFRECLAVHHQIMNTTQFSFVYANDEGRSLVADCIVDIASKILQLPTDSLHIADRNANQLT